MAELIAEKFTDICKMPLTEQENNLLDKWKKRYKENGEEAEFIKDGIVNEEKYTDGSHIRILYLLKETNGFKDPDYDLRKFIDKGACTRTWDNIAKWTYGIYNIYNIAHNWKEIDEIKAGKSSYTLSSICAVNIKKTSGGSTADGQTILSAAMEYGEYINKQIENARPELIIFCGTTYSYQNAIKKDLKWKKTSRGIDYFIDENGRIYISYYHPEARVNKCLLYYGLIDAVKEILNEPELNGLRSKYTWTKEF